MRWLIAVPAGLIFGLFVLGNGMTLIGALVERRREGGVSFFPLFAPVFGLVFFFSVPIPGARRYWWVALVADPISLISLALLFDMGLKKLVRSRDA